MAAPDGAIEQWTGYPTIDPQTINPFADWPIIQQAQADWLAQHSILDFANFAELTTLVASLPSTDTTFALTRDTGYLWYWSGGEWDVFSGTSPIASMAVGAGHTVTSGYPLQSRLVYSGGQGVVYFTGAVTRNGTNGTLATLGTGHRPSANRWAGAHVSSNGIAYSLLVQPSGAIGFAAGYATGSVVDGAVVPVSGSFPL